MKSEGWTIWYRHKDFDDHSSSPPWRHKTFLDWKSAYAIYLKGSKDDDYYVILTKNLLMNWSKNSEE